VVSQPGTRSEAKLWGRRVETAKPGGFAHDMAIHSFEHLVASRVGWQVEFDVQSIKLKHVVMQRAGTRARSKIRGRIAVSRSQPRAVSRSIGKIASPEPFNNSRAESFARLDRRTELLGGPA
jgi:hypothetical protein